MDYNTDIIIHIKGLYKADIDDDKFFEDDDDNDEYLESGYDSIPNAFTGLEYWISNTNISCINCSMAHDNVPIPIPDYFKPINNDLDINVKIEGVLTCSFPCAMTYIKKKYKDNDYENKRASLLLLYKYFVGVNTNHIECAPNPEEIDIFGGANARYTVLSFRKKINQIAPVDSYLI